jgi:dTDP-4-dehydrorhamnose reductase
MKHIIVTGGNGQLGSEIKELAPQLKDYTFHFFDFQEWDITDESKSLELFEKIKPSFLINCAAYTAVDKAETDVDNANKINGDCIAMLSRVCNQYGAHFIHVSTDFIFDGKKSEPYIESDSPHPISIYGSSKLLGEKLLQENSNSYTILRTSWVYSQFGNNFVKTMMKYGRERGALSVVFDQIGTPTYAADLAAAIVFHLNEWVAHKNNVYHFSNEGVASWYDFAFEIFQQKNIPCKVTPILAEAYPTPAARPKYSVMNKGKIKEEIGIEIAHWKESLHRCLQLLD